MEIDDKGGEIVQGYESFKIEIVYMKALGEIGHGEMRYKRNKGWTWTKREQH